MARVDADANAFSYRNSTMMLAIIGIGPMGEAPAYSPVSYTHLHRGQCADEHDFEE